MTDACLIEQVMLHLHNRFDAGSHKAKVKAEGGSASGLGSVPDGAWYWVDGTTFNDGLHRQGVSDWTDEEAACTVTVCAVPKALLCVVSDIAEWREANRAASLKAAASPYTSESFDGYSYSLRGDLAGSDGSSLSDWQAQFASRLNPWRKIG